MNYYDAILMAIPAFMVIGGGIAAVTPVSYQLAIVIGAGVSVLAVGHGMFIRPPVDLEKLPTVDSTEPEQSTVVNKTQSVIADD